MEKFRVAILLKNLKTIGKNFNTREEVNIYIERIIDTEKDVKVIYIEDKETGERDKI